MVRLLKECDVTLEMCPTSNRQTHAVEDMSGYPLMDYLNEGIKVTLNTDDMGIEDITLADEFRYMEELFGLNYDQKKLILENAVNASFTTNEVKDWLRKELEL